MPSMPSSSKAKAPPKAMPVGEPRVAVKAKPPPSMPVKIMTREEMETRLALQKILEPAADKNEQLEEAEKERNRYLAEKKKREMLRKQ